MSFITLGTSDQLQIKIPIKKSTGWADQLREEFFQKIVEHDHSGNGKGSQLGPGSLSDNVATDLNIRLRNDQYLRSRNASDDGDINILKINASDNLELGVSVETLTAIGTITSAIMQANTQINTPKINLAPQANPPVSPVEGDTYYDNGTNRTRGVYTYDGASFTLPPSSPASDLVVKIENPGTNDLNMDLDTQLLINDGATSGTLVLQDPASVPGRLLYVRCNDIGTSASLVGGGSISVNSAKVIDNGFPKTYLFVSDGINWRQMGIV